MAYAKIIFLIMIGSPVQERDAGLLIDSIRSFGGAYSNVPIYLVVADKTHAPGATLAGKAAKIIQLEMPRDYRYFPFADKVYACAQVEEMVQNEAEWIVWFNPEMLVVAEPSALSAPPEVSAVLRPVHIANVGSPASEPPDLFWQGVYKAAGIEPNRAWSVQSFIDRQTVRAYYNSGFMAYRPSTRIFRSWKSSFEAVLADPPLLERLCPDDQHKFFLHQAILSAVTVGRLKEDEIKIMPPAYGYPLLLHTRVPEAQRPTSSNGIITLIHDGGLQQLLLGIEVDPKLQDWLQRQGVDH